MRLAGRARVRIQLAYAIGEYTELEPDLAVVPKDEPWDDHPGHALLVIEVADSSLCYDRGLKASLYASSGLPEYWVVDAREQVVEIRRTPDGDRYLDISSQRPGDVLSVGSFSDVAVAVSDVFGLRA